MAQCRALWASSNRKSLLEEVIAYLINDIGRMEEKSLIGSPEINDRSAERKQLFN